MRIACLHLPGTIVQLHVRAAPHLASGAFAVLQETEGKVARIVACSRRANERGIKPGMTATQARAVASEVKLVDADPAGYQHALRALGEVLLALSVTVEVPDGPGPLYMLVPPGSRGPSFGERVLEAVARQGLIGRVGIADDRFTAWAATHALERLPVRAVPAGGSAAFLAPLSMDLLPLDADVRRTLGLLGIRTLGDFAALPAPSVGRRWAQGGVDVQALARGEDHRPLCAFWPDETVREQVELDGEVTELEPIAFVLRPLCERVTARLAGRGRAAARVAITLAGNRQKTVVTIAPARPTSSARTLVDLARAHLQERRLEHAVDHVALEVLEHGELEAHELDLFERPAAAPGAVDVAIARLRAAFGPDSATGTTLVDRHRPEAAWQLVSFTGEPVRARRRTVKKKKDAAAGAAKKPDPLQPTILPALLRSPGALRLLDPPTPCEVELDGDTARMIRVDGVRHAVSAAAGPTRLEAEWWTDEPLARDYYEVATEDGGRYWLYRDHADGGFYLHGVFD